MILIRDGQAAVLLLVLTQVFHCSCVNHEKDEANALTEMVMSYLRLPWIDGLNWLAQSSESPEREKVRALIRGVESREPWALRVVNTLWKDEPAINERKIGAFDSASQCGISASDIDRPDGTVLEGTTPDGQGFTVTGSDATSPYTYQNCQIAERRIKENAEKSTAFTMAEITVIVLFLVLAVVLLGCTVCDFAKRKKLVKSSAAVDTLAQFSLYTNTLAVLSTDSTPEMMPAIQGIRCLSCFMVLYGHRHFAMIMMLSRKIHLLDLLQGKSTWFSILFMMSTFAVDTFCVIGGFLGAYVFFQLKRSGTKFNVLTMYFYRYLRLTPCIVVMLLFVSIFFHRCGSGPVWDNIIAYVIRPCQGNWWINFFYVQNVVPHERICLTFTWYLAADMQLFLLSPLILYPLYRFPKFGLRLLGFCLIISLVPPVIILVVNDYSTVMLRLDQDFPKQLKNFGNFYISTYNRVFPYLIGILLGYDVSTKKRYLSQVNVIFNWTVATSLILFCTWLHNSAHKTAFTNDWNVRIASALLLSPLWCVAMAWVIYACTQGYGGPVTRFLSLPIFMPLSRISYCVYLVHMAVEAITISASESPGSVLGSNMFNSVIGNLMLSIAVAFVFTLFIESPTIILTKMLMTSRARQPAPGSLVKDCK